MNMKTHFIDNKQINCSIRLNTTELVDWLKSHGYEFSNTFCCNDDYIFVTETKRIHSTSNPYFCNQFKGVYDSLYGLYCDDDIDMFKALTALSDETDKDQLFVLDTNLMLINDIDSVYSKGNFVICGKYRWFVDVNEDGTPHMFSSRNVPAHKATIDEIVEFYTK